MSDTFSKAKDLITQALDEKDNKKAIKLFEEGIKAFEIHLKYEKNPNAKQIIENRVEEYRKRVLQLRELVEKETMDNESNKIYKVRTTRNYAYFIYKTDAINYLLKSYPECKKYIHQSRSKMDNDPSEIVGDYAIDGVPIANISSIEIGKVFTHEDYLL